MLDFIFGRTKTSPTSTVRTTSKLPEEIAPYVKEVLKEAQEQYAKDIKDPYLPYTGETIAPRDELELQAIEKQKGLVGVQDPFRKEAEEIIRGIPTEFTAETAQKFMSPFQQAVVDLEKQKSQEDFEQRILPAFEKQAIDAGGLSGLGSRAGVTAALLGEAQAERLGEIQTRGSQKAYEDALKQFTLAGELGRQRASDLERIGLDKFNIGIAESGLLQGLGQAERDESQKLLDKDFSDFLEEKEFPKQALAQYSSFVYGNPFLRKPDTTETTTGRGRAPIGSQLLSAGLSGLNLYGRGTKGFTEDFGFKNIFRSKKGGQINKGLRSLPVVNRQGGGGISMGIDPYLTPGSLSTQARELESAGETNLESGVPLPKTILATTFLNKAKQDKIRATNAAINASARAARSEMARQKAEQNIAMRDSFENQLMEKLRVSEDKPFNETYGGKLLSKVAQRLVDPKTQDRGILANFVGADKEAGEEVIAEKKEKEKRDIAKLKAGVDVAQKKVNRPGQQKLAALEVKKLEKEIGKIGKLDNEKIMDIMADKNKYEQIKKSYLNIAKIIPINDLEEAFKDELDKSGINLKDVTQSPDKKTANFLVSRALEYTARGNTFDQSMKAAIRDAIKEKISLEESFF